MRARRLLPLLVLLAGACKSAKEPDLVAWIQKEQSGQSPVEPASPSTAVFTHQGPAVAAGGGGPARFALLLHDSFEEPRALAFASFVDRWWREPGNDGFEAVLDRIQDELGTLGFGSDPTRELRVIETPMNAPAWTPLAGRLVLRSNAGERVLHAFDAPEDRDRLMLPKNAPAADVEGRIVLEPAAVEPGSVLVVEEHLGTQLVADAKQRGAVAVLSASLEPYNTDKSGRERHLDALQYASNPAGNTLPVGQISRRSLALIRTALAADPAARVALHAAVRSEQRPLRTLVATLVGKLTPGETIALAAHVQEPGACDNASGVATQLEALRALVAGLDSGRIERPARSLSFVWGLELRQSSILLEQGGRKVFAAIAADMTGESREATGAWPLLERAPDPGATRALPPDEHTEWGVTQVTLTDRDATGLSLIARTALHDVALAAGGWETREHPFEGGSDHQVFLRAGVPAVLFWHFTDFAYHTSLDRMEHVDAGEMRRMGSAIAATALALADPRPGDLERYLRTLKLETALRVQAAADAKDTELGQRWSEWGRMQRQWLRKLCLGDVAGELPPPAKKAAGESAPPSPPEKKQPLQHE